MLRRLNFDLTFPTGIHLVQDIDFTTGTTAITGKNGKGKSTVLEMIAYALFGLEAARGSAEDYKKSEVELEVSIKGTFYRFQRKNGTNANVHRFEDGAWAILATGTKAVNLKTIELLGYGYEVFKASNLIGQGQIEALGAMRPTERRQLVDSVIGLDAIDVVVEWANQEALLARREAEARESGLVEPELPVVPEGYRPSDQLKELIETLGLLKTERDQINGWLSHPVPQPVEPTCSVTETAAELAELSKAHVASVTGLKALEDQLAAIPEPEKHPFTLDEMQELLNAKLAWDAYDKLVPKLDRPSMTEEQVEEWMRSWVEHDAWVKAKAAFDQHQITCPSCDHHFSPGFTDPGPEPKTFFSRVELLNELDRHKAWAKVPPEPELPRPVSDVAWNQTDLNRARLAAEKVKERKALEKQIKAWTHPADRQADYMARLRYEEQLTSYQALLTKYNAWDAARAIKLARLEDLREVDAKLSAAQAAYNTATIYERLVRQYDQALYGWQEAREKVEACYHKADQYKASVGALRTLKTKVKGFLVPSLNRVASKLIQEMTAGQAQELSQVVVSEDFDITVDGQDLLTLNGSGKTVANLAIRIGLGQILTNKVLSVLMCDEVDAACDDERAAAIAASLRSLNQSIGQIILVSHKDIEADHYLTF
jgi:DNA repair exonuclease SbcCD ATPase subunit